MNTRNWRTGFTLIEILVVLAIIGILSAVLYANFGDARELTKNKAFMAEMKELQLGIELYKAQNGQYPPAHGCGGPASFSVFTADTNNCGNNPIMVGVDPEFVTGLPSPTKSANPNCNIEYKVLDDGSWYKVTAINCIQGLTVSVDDELARCPNLSSCTSIPHCVSTHADFGSTIAVYSSGGECY